MNVYCVATSAWLWLTLSLPAAVSAAADESAESSELTELHFDDLMKLPVTSVSKRETQLSESPAAITVVTREDIAQSGATTLPELLRFVPGVEVSRNSAKEWAIGIRGFSDELANKVQVLIDGRSIYSAAVGGVHWHDQDVVLEDIERIEIIRGPGATLWGANAVNGVINIITQSAKDTQGGLAVMGYGTQEQPLAAFRYGAEPAAGLNYRIYGKYYDRPASTQEDGSKADDAWSGARGGFRVDWSPSAANLFTLQGDYYAGRLHEVSEIPVLTPPFSEIEHAVDHDDSQNLIARWTRSVNDTSQFTAQLYYDHAHVGDEERRDTYDLDMQQHFALGQRHDCVIGAGYRSTRDDIAPTPLVVVEPQRREQSLVNFFLQDSIALVVDKLTLTLGSKFEHTPFTGFEYQPSARLLWRADEGQIFWGAVSRAVRTPTRLERDGLRNTQAEAPATLFADFGNPQLQSEELLAYEAGYRLTSIKQSSLELATFYNRYDRLVAYEPSAPFLEAIPPPLHIVEPSIAQNSVNGHSYGAELAVRRQLGAKWRLSGGYSWLQARFRPGYEDDNPAHQFFLLVHGALAPALELNSSLSYFSATSAVASYLRWDLGLTWHPVRPLELSLTGQNLLKHYHREFDAGADAQFRIPRSVIGKLVWRF